jgi:myo-inositol-1(or 4)-monophosphatase
MPEYATFCERVARRCGGVLLEMRGTSAVHEKAPKDVVTDADFASQEVARQLIFDAFPHHDFLGEEDVVDRRGGSDGSAKSEFCWIVDPLDGTLNYVRQLPNYAVSVALRRGDEILVGAVYDPVLDECFAASAGGGATLNGAAIRASSCQQLARALVAASLPAEVPRDSPDVRCFVEMIHAAQAVRRLGSAALNLCYVASGRLDAYWATCVKVWDVAAGQLIVREAGGMLTHLDGTPFSLDRPQLVAAATPSLHREVQQVLGPVRAADES